MVEFDIQDSKFSPYMLDSIVCLLIRDTELLTKFFYTVDPSIFEGERKNLIELCYRHFENYKEAPGEYIEDIVQDYISKRPSKKILLKYLDKLYDLQPNKDYVLGSFGDYVKKVICQNSFDKAKVHMDRGNLEKAQEELVEGFKKANSISSREVFDLLLERGIDMVNEDMVEPNFRTFIEPYDKLTGGFHRKEMVLLFGPYSVGKTYMLIHFAKVAVIQGKKVLHVTLETPKDEIKARYASTMTASKVKLHQDMDGFKGKLFSPKVYDRKTDFLRKRGGKLWLIEGIAFSFNDLVALFNNIELTTDSIPDVVILDSPDQMEWGGRYRDEIANEKVLYRKLLDFRKEKNITLIVTTQGQRQKSENQVFKGHNIGGTIAKAQIPDTGLIVNQGKQDYENSKVFLYLFRHRGAKKFVNIEITQNLDIGQPVLSAKVVKNSNEEIIKEAEKLGMKFEETKKKGV